MAAIANATIVRTARNGTETRIPFDPTNEIHQWAFCFSKAYGDRAMTFRYGVGYQYEAGK